MSEERVFVTVIGKDRKGNIAGISTYLYRRSINIVDISQKIQDGWFVMTMLTDVSDANAPLEEISAGLARLGKRMRLSIQAQHENLFKMMHRV
jgi:predicted amino acid-binding ACT domain protein